MSLTRNAILNSKDRAVKEVEVKEWGGVVYIREMSGRERFDLQDRMKQLMDDAAKGGETGEEAIGVAIISAGARGELLVRCLCDKDGELIFSEDDVDQIEMKNSNVVQRLFELATSFNGMSTEDGDPESEEREAAKNF